jgi:hypothetical protein
MSGLSLRSRHEQLLLALAKLESMADLNELEHQVELGSVLRDVGDALETLLDKVKERLREHALQRSGGRPGKYSLTGTDLGVASVTIPEASLRLHRNKVADLRRALGDDFGLFFEEVTTHAPCKDFEGRVAALQEGTTRHLLLAAVERVEATPRVGFRRGESNKLEHEDPT